MMNVRLCLLVGAVLATPLCHSQDLLDIYNLALQQDPVLAESRARYEMEHTQLALGRERLLPSVTASASTARNAVAPSSDFSYAVASNANGYAVDIRQSVLDLQAWYLWQSARAVDQRARATLMKGEQDMIVRVARAYFDVLRSQDSLALADAEVAAAETGLTNAQRRLDVGLVPITDVNFQQATRDLALVTRLREERLLNQRRLALEVITDGAHEELEGLRDEFPIVPVDPASADAWVQLAADNSPDVQAAEFDYEANKDSARAARSAMLPRVTASARYNWQAATVNPYQLRANEAQTGAVLQLNLTLPLFAGGGNSARMRQAYHLRNLSEQTLTRVERENERSTRDNYFAVATDVLAVQAGRQAVLSAQTALESAESGLEVGIRNAVDLVNAQRDLFRAQRDLANARYDYVIDSLALKQAAGVITPEDVRALNEWLE
jgi:outer membrane protein